MAGDTRVVQTRQRYRKLQITVGAGALSYFKDNKRKSKFWGRSGCGVQPATVDRAIRASVISSALRNPRSTGRQAPQWFGDCPKSVDQGSSPANHSDIVIVLKFRVECKPRPDVRRSRGDLIVGNTVRIRHCMIHKDTSRSYCTHAYVS